MLVEDTHDLRGLLPTYRALRGARHDGIRTRLAHAPVATRDERVRLLSLEADNTFAIVRCTTFSSSITSRHRLNRSIAPTSAAAFTVSAGGADEGRGW